MLDVKYIAQNPDLVAKNAANKNEKKADIPRICTLQEQKKEIQLRLDQKREASNRKSQEIGQLVTSAKKAGEKPDPARIQAIKEEAKVFSDEVKEIEAKFKPIDQEIQSLMEWVPNMAHEDVPVAPDAEGNETVRTWGTRATFAFEPKAHWDIGKDLDILDEDRSANLSGSNFLLLKGPGARLERALINFMIDLHIDKHGYTEIWPPFIANRASMFGTGQLPKLEDDMYRLGKDEMWLIPTAEVPVTNLHRDEILNHDKLPIYYTAYTACFRREAGAYGRDTRGLRCCHVVALTA